MLKRFSDMLRQMFRSNAPAPRDPRADVAARLEQNVLKLVGNMPTLPDTAARAMAMADDPHVKFADFAQLIEGDVAIATALLRIANVPSTAGARRLPSSTRASSVSACFSART